jgi:hypothetical protein
MNSDVSIQGISTGRPKAVLIFPLRLKATRTIYISLAFESS